MKITLNATERKELLERFLRYVKIDTQSDENSETSPSTEKQKDLCRLLVDELKELGLSDVVIDQWGYVFATVPATDATLDAKVPVIGLLAHVDTAFGCSGRDVKPQIIDNYDGRDLVLPGNSEVVIRVAENPNLLKVLGHTLLTTDGTTLLGADDKAGIAEIMTVIAWLLKNPGYRHGRIRIGFTTDEEVGRGTEHFDVERFAANVGYTLDGSEIGEIEDETFCADVAKVTVTGKDVHPGYAKDKMINAVRVATHFVGLLPASNLPETTDGRESYLHPYDFHGDVSKVELKVLLRAFTVEELAERAAVLNDAAAATQKAFPGATVTVEVKEQYRNMGFKLAEKPEVMANLDKAVRLQGIEPLRKAIRGGTDGARLSFMGLPTPNVWAGGQNFHSLQEWASLEWMVASVETVIRLAAVWAGEE
jgi:tripeptide aminopeptidase